MSYIKRINGAVYNCASSSSAERGTTGSGQFINVGAVPLCPPVGWLGGIRLFVYSSIRLWEVLWNIAYWDVRG